MRTVYKPSLAHLSKVTASSQYRNPFTVVHRAAITRLAEQHRLPAIYALLPFAQSGGLLTYGTDTVSQYRQAASYIDRILKGERPNDLPIIQPTKLTLVINLKTAKAIGTAVPGSLLCIRRQGDRITAACCDCSQAAFGTSDKSQSPEFTVGIDAKRTFVDKRSRPNLRRMTPERTSSTPSKILN